MALVRDGRELAAWLVGNRPAIEAAMAANLGPARPSAGTPESEALRRFRSFAAAALMRGKPPAPALDGLRSNERRVLALIDAWIRAAADLSGNGPELEKALAPLVDHFRLALRSTGAGRQSKGTPRSKRRTVSAAIDRIGDAFLAVETEAGCIVDANPAAGALLGVQRDALLGIEAFGFVPKHDHQRWWNELDAASESDDARVFLTALVDRAGIATEVEASLTSFRTRDRVIALLMLRPRTRRAEEAMGLRLGSSIGP